MLLNTTLIFASFPGNRISLLYSGTVHPQSASTDSILSGEVPEYYHSLQSAYYGSGNGGVIQSQDYEFIGNLNIIEAISVTIQAGYDCDYVLNEGTTTVAGNVMISGGTLTIQSGTFMIM